MSICVAEKWWRECDYTGVRTEETLERGRERNENCMVVTRGREWGVGKA